VDGERRLDVLLAGMRPHLNPGEYVYCVSEHPVPQAIATFRESEGLTVVLERTQAELLGLQPVFEAEWITLTIHSALDAVGFLAVVAARLAEAGISCNVISAAYHDHLFVPRGRGADAIAALQRESA
jgi:uncharacterized protein